MSITRNFNLYLTAGRSIPLVINVNQYDQGETWVFTLCKEDGTQYVPSSGSIVGIKSDGNLIANAGTVDASGRIVITETEQMTASAGKAVFELQLDSETHGTANFIVMVEKDPSDGGTVSGSDIGLLRQALNGGLSQSAIDALLACFANVAWANDDGQIYYDALDDALNAVRGIYLDVNTLSFNSIGSTQQLTATTVPEGGTVSWESSNTSVATVSSSGLVTSAGYGTATITASAGDVSATCSVSVVQATLVSISAVYTQSGTVYTTDSLDSLKSDLVVTATYDNTQTETVSSSDYTLSGSLTAGTSTITVTYNSKTTTFTVTVTQDTRLYVLPQTTTFTGSNKIDTNVALMETDQNFTILLDFTNGTISSGTETYLLHDIHEASPYYGFAFAASKTRTDLSVQGPNASIPETTFLKTSTDPMKVVIRHTSSDGKYYIDGTINGTRQTQVVGTTAKTVSSVTETLVIGAKRNANASFGSYWKGELRTCVIDARAYSDSEVTTFLGA